VVTAIGRVFQNSLFFQDGEGDHLQRDAEVCCSLPGALDLRPAHKRAFQEDGAAPVPQDLPGDGGEERGVHPPGEGDEEGTPPGDLFPEPLLLCVQVHDALPPPGKVSSGASRGRRITFAGL
jgi:hypothetical protein